MKIVLLLIGHLIGDFVLQPECLAIKKKDSFKYQIIHAAIYAFVLGLVFILYDSFVKALVLFIITFVLHLLIDYLRITISENKNLRFQLITFVCDQLIHIIILYIIALYLYSFNKIGNYLNIDFQKAKLVLGILLILSPASVSIKHILNLYETKDERNVDICIDEDKIGSFIGKLERIIIVIFGIMTLYTSIALVFTAKSLARFKQLENKPFAERYLVGTLLSLLFGLIAIIIIKT
ncbi:MAG TPA: DUF3307 domain-containing protein [Acholeplasmataceae bacterium]|nr:DUF3307 domain-containing protein [Acholeplasmataceae bacterium]